MVGVIAPFNFPLILSMRAVAPALALGNAVVLKPDPRTAVCGGMALAAVFEEAGCRPGCCSVLPGGPDVGEALVPTRWCGDRLHRVHRAPAARSARWPASTSSAPTSSSAATPR